MSARSKTYERKVAKFFGTHRTPLSGGASRHTRSDTLHAKLYIEAKSVKGPGGTNGWIYRWLRKLMWPQLLLRIPGQKILYIIPAKHLDKDAWIGQDVVDVVAPKALDRLYVQTKAWAYDEDKTPILALFVVGRKGFWLVGEADALLAAMKTRMEVRNALDT